MLTGLVEVSRNLRYAFLDPSLSIIINWRPDISPSSDDRKAECKNRWVQAATTKLRQRVVSMSGSDSSESKRDSARSSRFGRKGMKPTVLQRHLLVPGTIIRAFHHEPNYQRTTFTGRDDHQTPTKQHGTVFSKTRHMIILANHSNHYQVVMLYSHNGNGLSGKKNLDKYVSITDLPPTDFFEPLSSHNTLYAEDMKDCDTLDLKSTVHITYLVSRTYNVPVILEGKLNDTSLKELLQLHTKAQLSAMGLSPKEVVPEMCSLESLSLPDSPASAPSPTSSSLSLPPSTWSALFS
ncbi:hypothetical protein MMC14_001163 [Varicellaria rhodocarpa]|nr:hypothetical protein [Varicellaria rhodocarpa]